MHDALITKTQLTHLTEQHAMSLDKVFEYPILKQQRNGSATATNGIAAAWQSHRQWQIPASSACTSIDIYMFSLLWPPEYRL
jgi:hypothetical protein